MSDAVKSVYLWHMELVGLGRAMNETRESREQHGLRTK